MKAEIRGDFLGFVVLGTCSDQGLFLQVWLYQSNLTSATAKLKSKKHVATRCAMILPAQ